MMTMVRGRLRALITTRVGFPPLIPPPIPARYSFDRHLLKCKRYPRCTQKFRKPETKKDHEDSEICVPLDERVGKRKNRKASSKDSSSSGEEEFSEKEGEEDVSADEHDSELKCAGGKFDWKTIELIVPTYQIALPTVDDQKVPEDVDKDYAIDASILRIMKSCVLKSYQHNKQMSCPGMGQLLSNALYYKRFFTYYAFNVLGGLDNEEKGCVFTYDAVGSYERVGYSSQGSGSSLIIPVLDNQLKSSSPLLLPARDAVTPLSESEAVDLVKDVFASAAERDIFTIALPTVDDQKVPEDVDKDYAIDASIVRIMKSCVLKGWMVLNEAVDVQIDFNAIKTRIKDLVTLDYLKREKDNLA